MPPLLQQHARYMGFETSTVHTVPSMLQSSEYFSTMRCPPLVVPHSSHHCPPFFSFLSPLTLSTPPLSSTDPITSILVCCYSRNVTVSAVLVNGVNFNAI